MKYLIVTNQTKQGKSGTPYQMVTLKDENGEHIEATTFDLPGKAVNETVEGDIVVNGRYTNFKLKLDKPAFMGRSGTKPDAMKVQDRIEKSVEKTLDRKDDSFKISGTARDATLIVTHFYDNLSDSQIQEKISYWRKWLWYEWDKHTDFPPFN